MSKSKYQKVKEFHKAFNYPMADKPTPMSMEMVLNRLGFIAEEMIEVLHVTSKDDTEFSQMYDQLIGRMLLSYAKQAKKERVADVLTGQFDGFLDIEYFNNGNYTILGLDPDAPFDLVHDANMNKLWEDGKPRYDEHGKIIKPPHFVPPDEAIKEEIKRQIENAGK
ncbi:pyrophosphohydrolase domain-containing protein [Paenibacillus cremeus]|uniref:HAD family hydrolase n=1 Tax=Paenibacillus cremeus TaxID=2163881 RepID=A0A559KCI4_9BACL|nr:HAD family hydrolase [Paenibacillus cremeus]TVY09838.1 HAD family hydrolase [Paenibacillus cremeus]